MGARARRKERILARLNAFFGKTPVNTDLHGPEVDLYFADDSKQSAPSRPGMGALVAIGGIAVPVENVRPLAESLDALCQSVGFPPNDEFKWSPSKNHWMWAGLVEQAREHFFLGVIRLLGEFEAHVLVVIEDTQYKTATAGASPELDLTRLFVERVEWQTTRQGALAIMIADRPGGGQKQDVSFLQDCLETLQSGTQYVKPTRIIHNVLSTPSHLSRLLQAADLVVGACVSNVAGETKYSPPIFAAISPLFWSDGSRIGGVGLKIHPDFRYCNLYHWLVGDTHFWRANTGIPLPLAGRPYSSSPTVL